MDVSAMIPYLRSTTGTDSNNYTTSDCLIDLNASYHTIEDAIIKKVGERYFWDKLTSTGVSGQSEYTFSTATSGNLKGINKTYGVSIDYGGTGIFKKAVPKDTDLMDYDSSYYETNADKDFPFYEIKDNSLFIYPTPTDGVSIIRHYAAHGLIDLSETTIESDIFNGRIASKYHYLVPLGARQYGFLRRGKDSAADSEQAEAKFNRELSTFLSSINTRDVSAKKRQTAPGFQVNPL